jgi:anaerobic selenocysteine-containing dehydrogenase
MTARPTFEISPSDAEERNIADGDLCRLYNDRGETFGYALLVEGLLPGVLGAPKQLQGSKMRNGVNLNALTSQEVADMGGGPVFFSTLAQLEKVADLSGAAVDPTVYSSQPASAR